MDDRMSKPPGSVDLSSLYDKLLAQSGGNYGELFNKTEEARAGKPSPELAGLPPEKLVELNRMAQSADVPATALLSVPYEGLKGIQQKTGIPALSWAGGLANKVGIPVALPKGNTSQASLGN